MIEKGERVVGTLSRRFAPTSAVTRERCTIGANPL
jgi:hypothetical protein